MGAEVQVHREPHTEVLVGLVGWEKGDFMAINCHGVLELRAEECSLVRKGGGEASGGLVV